MRRNQRLHALEGRTPVALEGVGYIVEPEPEQYPDKPVGHTVNGQLMHRVVQNLAALNESRAKCAIVSLLDLPVVPNQILGAVGAIRHHHGYSVASSLRQPGPHSQPEAMRTLVSYQSQTRIAPRRLQDTGRCLVRAAIIHHYDLKRNLTAVQSLRYGADGLLDGAFLVTRWDDNR